MPGDWQGVEGLYRQRTGRFVELIEFNLIVLSQGVQGDSSIAAQVVEGLLQTTPPIGVGEGHTPGRVEKHRQRRQQAQDFLQQERRVEDHAKQEQVYHPTQYAEPYTRFGGDAAAQVPPLQHTAA